jgi:hypothetical protein
MHRRGGYVVDGYVLHTGPTETTVVRRADVDEVALVYQRLLEVVVSITCADCYADPARRARHQSWAYPAD